MLVDIQQLIIYAKTQEPAWKSHNMSFLILGFWNMGLACQCFPLLSSLLPVILVHYYQSCLGICVFSYTITIPQLIPLFLYSSLPPLVIYLHYTLLHCGKCTIHCTLYSAQCKLHCVKYTVYTVLCKVYSVQCTLYSVQ